MIIGIDKRGNDLGAIDFVETQWNRKWSSCGDFVVYMPASKYDPRIKYIQNSGRPETGIVQKVEYDEKSNGKFITLSGYFIDKIADGGAMYKTWKLGSELMAPRDAIETYLKTTLSGFVDGVGFVSGCCSEPTYKHEIAEASVLPAALAKTIVAETPTGQALFEALGGDGYSYHCEPIFAPEDVSENEYPIIGLSFVFKAGRNLADKVFFGENYNNVSGIKIIEDESNIKNSIVLTYKVDSLDGWDGFESFETTEDGVTSYYLYQKYDTSAINPVSGVGRSSNGMVQELDDKYAKKIKDLP
ncbi:MAG: hypothetical protein IKK92_00680, partial [Prevotella sp.]|nr:hypothetical protein [Prevotella sp.]